MPTQTLKKKKPVEIQPLFPQLAHSPQFRGHLSRAQALLEELLPEEVTRMPREKAGQWLRENLPLLKWTTLDYTPGSITLQFLFAPNQEVQAEKVLVDVIRKWLIPEKEAKILSHFNLSFYWRSHSSKLLFLAEVELLIEDAKELSLIEEHLPYLANELSLSLSSQYYLENVLDTRALSLDQKSSQIQRYLRKLVGRSPKEFEGNIFREMSTFFALSNPEFRKFRMPKQLTRLIVSHYLMRKKMLHLLSVSPEKRHIEFRFIRSKLFYPFGTKPVLGLSIAVALTNRYETFEETHILSAVQKYVPDFKIVKGSYYSHKANHDPIKYIYLELEKRDGSPFFLAEVKLLNQELKHELLKRIERLIPSVFMIRNEEEVMRNILLLSQELKYLSDIPQVMINFEKQEGEELFFTILLVRVLRKHDEPLEKRFHSKSHRFRFLPDRVQNVGYIRKKNPKEVNVFQICIPKERSILRSNSSVNFYLARGRVMEILNEALGDVRDYNGGMILKQGELFSRFRESFSSASEFDHDLLENFFFGLTPIESQATSSLNTLKTLFRLFQEADAADIQKRGSFFQKITKRKNTCLAVLKVKDPAFGNILGEELSRLDQFSKALVKTQVTHHGAQVHGIFYETTTLGQKKDFQKAIDTATSRWKTRVLNQQELRLSFTILPRSLDPRLGGDEYSSAMTKMLFEGLTRIDRNSKPALALAESIDISADKKVYTFRLQPSKWSDGSPLLPQHFEYAWKKILSPSFYTPFAYFFFPIKHAKAAKSGEVPVQDVGIRSIGNQVLQVELENPTPEFLEQVAHPIFSPINEKNERLHPNWAEGTPENYLCNGPMKLRSILPNGGYVFEKNLCYWDEKAVKLDTIRISRNNSETALEMYNNGEIDWLGHPMRPWESYFPTDKLHYTKFLGTQWCVFNTQRFPFDNVKMRQAFTYVVNRDLFSQSALNSTMPAVTPLPHIHTNFFNQDISYGNIEKARALFEEALQELGITRASFPILSLFYGGGAAKEMVAKQIARSWEEAFGISCRLQDYTFQTLFAKMTKGEFHLGMMGWKSWVNDPFYTLGAFQYKSNRVNFPKWEHPVFQRCLERASAEVISENRAAHFKEAEQILIEQCPVIPIFHEAYRYTHKPELRGAFCSDSGNVDFKWCSIVSS